MTVLSLILLILRNRRFNQLFNRDICLKLLWFSNEILPSRNIYIFANWSVCDWIQISIKLDHSSCAALSIIKSKAQLSHSTPSTASLGQRDLIPWSAHETAQTWVCNFRDLTRHNSDCDVTVIYRSRTLFNCEREESTWSHDFLNGVYLWFFCLHFSLLPILLILSSFFPFCNN